MNTVFSLVFSHYRHNIISFKIMSTVKNQSTRFLILIVRLTQMKKILVYLWLTIFLFTPGMVSAQGRQEVITDFSSKITINQDTSITIEEEIDYQTTTPKHGIYRYLPIRYQRNGFTYKTKIKEIEIRDGSGSPISYSQYIEKGNLTLKIGDPNNQFSGQKTYLIEYTVENALRRFKDYDELYWDITGEGWQIPIEKSTAIVSSPFAKITKIECYSGEVGTDDGLCQKGLNDSLDNRQAFFFYPEIIDYGKNLTVAVALDPSGSIVFPTAFQQFRKWMSDNLLLFFLPIPLLIFFLLWFKKGRDFIFDSPNVFNLDENQPKRLKPLFFRHRLPFVYEPLKDLTAGETGAILDEKVDNRDVTAEILDLARKKYLKISPLERGKNDFKFEKIKEADSGLPEHQRYLLESIFNSEKEKKLSDLKGSFYMKMQEIKELINKSITAKGLFTKNPRVTKIKYFILFFLIDSLFFPVLLATSQETMSIWPAFLFIGQSLAGLFFVFNMPQKTAKGTNLMLQARGLRETIKLGKWREEIKEKNLFIEEIFPFAVALGVVNKLAKDMEALNLKPPSYLESYVLYHGLSLQNFTSSFSSQVSSSFTYNPSSSGWSGGSGFSGGSSGGGGGGGGGSW